MRSRAWPLPIAVALILLCWGGYRLAVRRPSPPVVEWVRAVAPAPCDDLRRCWEDYLRLPDLANQGLPPPPLSDDALEKRIRAARTSLPSHSGLMDESELRRKIVDGLKIDFLLEGLEKRPLRVQVLAERSGPGYWEKELLLTDPFVGSVPGILLLPEGPGEHPAILALHGHGGSAVTYRDEYGGALPARLGTVVFMPSFRVMGADEDEDRLSRFLQKNHLTLMSLRVYESLLGIKLLKSMPIVSKDRIGMIGHSGGAVIGNLVVRLSPDLKAYATDSTSSYLGVHQGKWLLDDFLPDIFPVHKQINDFASSTTPIRMVPYEQATDPKTLFDFFDTHLKGD